MSEKWTKALNIEIINVFTIMMKCLFDKLEKKSSFYRHGNGQSHFKTPLRSSAAIFFMHTSARNTLIQFNNIT